jgi:hypothetical protein
MKSALFFHLFDVLLPKHILMGLDDRKALLSNKRRAFREIFYSYNGRG